MFAACLLHSVTLHLLHGHKHGQLLLCVNHYTLVAANRTYYRMHTVTLPHLLICSGAALLFC